MGHIIFKYIQLQFRCLFLLLPLAVYSHSMTRVNLNKSEEFVTNTTAVSKYIPKRSRICINPNSNSIHKTFKNCFFITSQHSHLEVRQGTYILLLNKFWSERGNFN